MTEPYRCAVCHRLIRVEPRGNPHPSPGDHDPAYHVAAAYKTGWLGEPAPTPEPAP